jgi:hypothetical protein
MDIKAGQAQGLSGFVLAARNARWLITIPASRPANLFNRSRIWDTYHAFIREGAVLNNKAGRPVFGLLANEVFAPRQQRYQLDRKIGDYEGSQRDHWYTQKSIPKNGRQSRVNRVEYDDVRQIHTVTHARNIVDQPPCELVAVICMNVSEQQE